MFYRFEFRTLWLCRKNRVLYAYIGILLGSIIANAQVQINGTIVDKSTNEVLPGANIVVKDTNIGVQSDFDGNFSIVASQGNVLVVSYLGYITVEINIDQQTDLRIELVPDAAALEEIIVVGYGTKSKTKLISAISSVDSETLKKVPVPSVSNALEGLSSGLFVRQTSGEPGFSNSSFEIRNFGGALVIVDGSPGDLNQLDPNEIESISVLKDAAAASVYGVQGGNGVVLIETIKGSIGKPTLTYNNQFTFTAFTSYPNFLSSVEYAQVLNEGLRNANQELTYSEDEINAFRDQSDPVNYPNTNWREMMLEEWGFQHRHNLNVNGGSEQIRYFVSAGFLDQGSNYTSDVLSFQQFNVRANIEADISDDLRLKFNVSGRRKLNEAPGYSAYEIFRELSRALPTDLAYYPDGTPSKPTFSPNHIVEGVKDFNTGYYRARNNNIDAKLSLTWEVNQIKGLKLTSYASLIYDNFFSKDWGQSYNLYTLNRNTGNYDLFLATPENAFSDTVLDQATNFSNHYVFQESIKYDQVFGDHTVSGLLLAEIQLRQGQNFSGRRQDFQSTLIDQLYAGSLDNQGANGGEFRENRLGIVGRFSYDFKSRYLVETSFRYDGSSRFAPGNQWGFFPSISVGWRISEESFFENFSSIVNSLKLRGSVGTAGNDSTAAFQWLSGFVYNHFFISHDQVIPTIDNTALPNKDITWETITTYDVGVDFNLLENDFSFSFDYFFRERKDVIAGASASVPSTLGIALADQNLYEFSNQGFEFSATYIKQFSDIFRVNSGINFSRAREKAVFIDEAPHEDPFMRANLTQTGGFTNLRRGYISQGLFQTEDEILQSPVQDGNGNISIRPGDVKYVDLNGDNVIDVKDQKVFGNGDKPAINYSINLGAEYQNLSVSVLLTGAAGYDIYLDGEAQSPLRNGFNGYSYQLDYWSSENTGATFPRISNGGFNDNNYRYSDFWLRKGSHLRFKNINLSYSIPYMKDKLGFKEVRIFWTGYNLFVIKRYNEEFDPQNTSSVGWYYPHTRSITFGINVKL